MLSCTGLRCCTMMNDIPGVAGSDSRNSVNASRPPGSTPDADYRKGLR